MLKHKGRERREEKRREKKRGRRSLCWSFGLSFLGQFFQELLQKRWSWRGSKQCRCWSLSVDPRAVTLLGAVCAGITHRELQSRGCMGNNCTGTACKENPVETILLEKKN